MKEIPLTKGYVTVVDDDTYEWASKLKWHVSGGYAGRNGKYINGKRQKSIKLHRIIMEASNGIEVDHINGDTLDNRRENLRLCTHSENGKNYSKPNTNTSGYKGVRWHNRDKCWEAYIRLDNKQFYIGRFDNLEDAAIAYNSVAQKHYKQFAKLNGVK